MEVDHTLQRWIQDLVRGTNSEMVHVQLDHQLKKKKEQEKHTKRASFWRREGVVTDCTGVGLALPLLCEKQ